jgi:precorrin-3B C17-methyltransferase
MKNINVVGIGPGAWDKMTIEAARALEESDTIIGYTVYIDLVRDRLPGKEFLSTPMKKEADRCRLAFAEAEKGKNFSLICSGDAGVYGMSGLMYRIGKDYPEVNLRIIPGVTAALAGAAVLGAPLIHDFCLISLSDLLTPIDKIRKRLEAAGEADFAVVLYNPSSRKRSDYLAKACDILLRYRDRSTVCGIVENIGREGEKKTVLTLGELRDTPVNMFTTVFIGNSQTTQSGDFMVTPRGYRDV